MSLKGGVLSDGWEYSGMTSRLLHSWHVAVFEQNYDGMCNLLEINLAWRTCSCCLIFFRFFFHNEHVFIPTICGGGVWERSINQEKNHNLSF